MKSKSEEAGFLLGLLVLLLAFLALLGATQCLLVCSAIQLSQALDLQRQDLVLNDRLARLSAEAFYQRDASKASTLAHPLQQLLESLDAGGARVEVLSSSVSEVRSFSFPFLNPESSALVVQTSVASVCPSPGLARFLGTRFLVEDLGNISFGIERRLSGGPRRTQTAFGVRGFDVPLTRFPVATYELPSEVGFKGEVLGSSIHWEVFPLGLARSRDPHLSNDLQGPGDAIPYLFRNHARLAVAYQDLFSGDFVARFLGALEVERRVNLDDLACALPLPGFRRETDAWVWDLGNPGCSGLYAFVSRAGARFQIVDTSSGGGEPLVLLVLGSPSAPLSLQWSSVRRPVLALVFNSNCEPGLESVWAGALMLDPQSSLQISEGGSCSFGHLSIAAAKAVGLGAGLGVLPAFPEALSNLAPRVRYYLGIPL